MMYINSPSWCPKRGCIMTYVSLLEDLVDNRVQSLARLLLLKLG